MNGQQNIKEYAPFFYAANFFINAAYGSDCYRV